MYHITIIKYFFLQKGIETGDLAAYSNAKNYLHTCQSIKLAMKFRNLDYLIGQQHGLGRLINYDPNKKLNELAKFQARLEKDANKNTLFFLVGKTLKVNFAENTNHYGIGKQYEFGISIVQRNITAFGVNLTEK
jgi:hypothetical protein